MLGVLAAFAVFYPDEQIYLYFLFPVKAKYFVPFFAALDLWAGLSDSGSNVAHFAHLGGMAVGLPLAFLWKRQAARRRRS